MATLTKRVICCTVLARILATATSQDATDAALMADDECSGYTLQGNCALNALQLQGNRKSEFPDDDDDEVVPTEQGLPRHTFDPDAFDKAIGAEDIAPESNKKCAYDDNQCGGATWRGPRCCTGSSKCIKVDHYYSQCRQNVKSGDEEDVHPDISDNLPDIQDPDEPTTTEAPPVITVTPAPAPAPQAVPETTAAPKVVAPPTPPKPAVAPKPAAAPTPTNCKDLTPGDHCDHAVRWAMRTGIRQHPNWYPGLTSRSSAKDFQAQVHKADPGRCPMPCSHQEAAAAAPAPAVATGPTCASYGCSQHYAPQNRCQCNRHCKRFGNCCSDFSQVCRR
eukprot:TRINITY_DN93844_c0_g1_i1.p1 TRINITY_DN93844_c0_g1~~TRINITY_DN93844_c0_g1_i1.p1  ORF type:complete len:335 (+),score=86.00 TRINITY_DN93844_c0_g1_i1:101-1105(+)